MNAAIVCVDYADLLAVTLPYNRLHFGEVLVVTSTTDVATLQVASEHRCTVYRTDAFFAKGAPFNKWAALEEGLDRARFRRGWLCLMDADILWPRDLVFGEGGIAVGWPQLACRNGYKVGMLTCGQLWAPFRRMRPELTVCDESEWSKYNIHRNVREWAGYSQIFHCSDFHLGAPPWHEIDWKHAGGADSFFQNKWPVDRKFRPPFECLHLGEPGVNWMGRADKDPSLRARMLEMFRRRRDAGFSEEKV